MRLRALAIGVFLFCLTGCECGGAGGPDATADSAASDAGSDAGADAAVSLCAEGPEVIEITSLSADPSTPSDLVPVGIVRNDQGFTLAYWEYVDGRCELRAESRDTSGGLSSATSVEALDVMPFTGGACGPRGEMDVLRPWIAVGDTTYVASPHSRVLYSIDGSVVTPVADMAGAPLAWSGATLVFHCKGAPILSCGLVYLLTGASAQTVLIPDAWKGYSLAGAGDAGRVAIVAGVPAGPGMSTLTAELFDVLPDALLPFAGPFDLETAGEVLRPMAAHLRGDDLVVLFTNVAFGAESGGLALAVRSVTSGALTVSAIAESVLPLRAYLASTSTGFIIVWTRVEANDERCAFAIATTEAGQPVGEAWSLGEGVVGGVAFEQGVAGYLLLRESDDGVLTLALGVQALP